MCKMDFTFFYVNLILIKLIMIKLYIWSCSMKIMYVGPKPIISEHGISFKEGKEDKYSYLKHALQILDAISHEYEGKRKYSYDITDKNLSDSDMIDILFKYHCDMEEIMNEELDNYNIFLEKEKFEVVNHPILVEEEKQVYINNLDIMKEYKIQRIKNKLFYTHVIETIKEQLLKHKIKELNSPFNEKFWHVFKTIQGELLSSRGSISATLKTKEEDILRIRMEILNNF